MDAVVDSKKYKSNVIPQIEENIYLNIYIVKMDNYCVFCHVVYVLYKFWTRYL